MNERINNIIRHPLTIPTSVGIVSFGVGVGVGYILARKTGRDAELYEIPSHVDVSLTEEDLRELQEEEEEFIDGVSQFIKDRLSESLSDPSDEISPEEVPTIVEIDGEEFETEDSEHLKIVGSPPEVAPVPRNAFASSGADDHWDYEDELRRRTDEEPYVLHKDEFFAEEKGYTQVTCVYYEGDRIMVDSEEEKPIYNHERTTGPLRFGHGSGDPNTFYVRNDKLKAEFEVLKDPGLYSVEVLGLEIEDNQRVKDLKHMHEPQKFRRE